MTEKRFSFSLNSLIRTITCFMILFMVVCSVLIYTIANRVLDEQIRSFGNSAVMITGHGIDQTLQSVDAYVFELLYNNQAISDLNGSLDELRRYEARSAIQSDLDRLCRLCPVDGIMLYSPKGDQAEYVVHSGSSVLFSANRSIAASLIESINQGDSSSSSWHLSTIDNSGYVIHTFFLNQAYLCIWFQKESLLASSNYDFSDVEGIYDLTFALSDQVSDAAREEPSFRLFSAPSACTLRYPLRAGDITLNLTANTAAFSTRISRLLLLSGVVLILFAALMLLINRRFMYHPLTDFCQTMQQIGNGDLSVRMKPDSGIRDFNEIYLVFNRLIDDIQRLQLDVYEKKLSKRKTEQQFLHIQLRNHFFLNCLSIIYSLAQARDYDLIQKLTLYLTGYFRHISADAMKPVTLGDEVEHVINYLHIQQIRFPDRIRFNSHMNPELSSFPVPSLILLTFIENSIIHAPKNSHSVLTIDLTLERAPEPVSSFLSIRICDNGPGFTDEQFDELNTDPDELPFGSGHRVGIRNIRSRLRLLYMDDASLKISNDPQTHGARIELLLPPWPVPSESA